MHCDTLTCDITILSLLISLLLSLLLSQTISTSSFVPLQQSHSSEQFHGASAEWANSPVKGKSCH